jgi:hypothetical protein
VSGITVTELEATLLIKYINYFTICLCYLKLTVYSNFKVQFGTINNMNECYMKMSTVVYSIKQQKKIMCFLLPVDSKPVADKMSVYKSKAIFEIEQC